MSTDEYVPTVQSVRDGYVWLSAEDNPGAREMAEEEFDRFLARVRRDAAREALDGLIANMAQIANGSPDPLTRTSATITARLAGEYKTNVYPEESP